jgi:hypothetical protein
LMYDWWILCTFYKWRGGYLSILKKFPRKPFPMILSDTPATLQKYMTPRSPTSPRERGNFSASQLERMRKLGFDLKLELPASHTPHRGPAFPPLPPSPTARLGRGVTTCDRNSVIIMYLCQIIAISEVGHMNV